MEEYWGRKTRSSSTLVNCCSSSIFYLPPDGCWRSDSGKGGQEKSSQKACQTILPPCVTEHFLLWLPATCELSAFHFQEFLSPVSVKPPPSYSQISSPENCCGRKTASFLCCGFLPTGLPSLADGSAQDLFLYSSFFPFFFSPQTLSMIYRPELLFIIIHLLSPVHWRLIEMPARLLIYLVKYLFQGLGQMIGVWASFGFMHYEKQADLTLSH